VITYTEIRLGIKIIFLSILYFNNLYVLCAFVGNVFYIYKTHGTQNIKEPKFSDLEANVHHVGYTAGDVFSLFTGIKKKSFPATCLDRPLGFQEVQAPEFLDNRHMKVVRLSALRTGRLYSPGRIPGTHF
jgi:hypothetical protein